MFGGQAHWTSETEGVDPGFGKGSSWDLGKGSYPFGSSG